MDLGLKGKTILVTGASSGIGRAIAEAYGREQANVAITYHRDSAGAEETVRSIEASGGKAIAIPMSLTDEASIRQAVDVTMDAFGELSVLVNNALDWSKRGGATSMEESDAGDWMEMIQANLFGTYRVTRAVVPSIKRAGWGRIVYISSDLAVDGMPGSSSYTSTKSALHGLSRTLSKELAQFGIFSNVVLPGLTLTERAKASFPKHVVESLARQNPTGRLGVPDDVANVVVFLGSPGNRFVNGEVIRVTGGHRGGYYTE